MRFHRHPSATRGLPETPLCGAHPTSSSSPTTIPRTFVFARLCGPGPPPMTRTLQVPDGPCQVSSRPDGSGHEGCRWNGVNQPIPIGNPQRRFKARGTCFGDSGGLILQHGTDTIWMVSSFGLNGTCSGIGGGYRIDQADDVAFLADPTTGTQEFPVLP
jgi:hypothetical protein